MVLHKIGVPQQLFQSLKNTCKAVRHLGNCRLKAYNITKNELSHRYF